MDSGLRFTAIFDIRKFINSFEGTFKFRPVIHDMIQDMITVVGTYRGKIFSKKRPSYRL